jgi:hypothetical protein
LPENALTIWEDDVSEWLDWLSHTPYAQWVDESWGWPIALTVHAFGNAIIVGLMFIIALRVLGLFRTIPYTSLPALIPYVWVSFLLQVASGFTLWLTKPQQYLADGMFEFKFTFVILSAIGMVVFQRTITREAAAWQAAGKPTIRGRRITLISAVLWAFVLIGGRLTAYLGQLYAS